MLKVGLAGSPVGIWLQSLLELRGVIACAFNDRTNGFRPPMGAIKPAEVKRPHLTKSRREIFPCDKALVISARFWRAFSASLSRRGSASGDNQIPSCPWFLRPIPFLLA